jgi:hypothetical protein
MEYDKLEHVYYGSSDIGFGRVIEHYEAPVDNFVGVIGGLSFLNFIALNKFKNIILFDINPYSVIMCELVLKVIARSKDAEDLFNNLDEMEVKGTLDQKRIIANLKEMGSAYFSGEWETAEIEGRKRVHPKDCWSYALANFKSLKKNLKTNIEYKVANCEDIFDLVDKPSTWFWISNIPVGKKSDFKNDIKIFVSDFDFMAGGIFYFKKRSSL